MATRAPEFIGGRGGVSEEATTDCYSVLAHVSARLRGARVGSMVMEGRGGHAHGVLKRSDSTAR